MIKEILLLKTCLHNYNDIQRMSVVLSNNPRIASWNIDLDDIDKILRIKSKGLKVGDIVDLLRETDIWSEELLD